MYQKYAMSTDSTYIQAWHSTAIKTKYRGINMYYSSMYSCAYHVNDCHKHKAAAIVVLRQGTLWQAIIQESPEK